MRSGANVIPFGVIIPQQLVFMDGSDLCCLGEESKSDNKEHLLLLGATEQQGVDLGSQSILEWCNAACKKPLGLSSEKVIRNVHDLSAPEV